ncbi:MAG: rod-binding protein [Candidatus Manganitrophus sp. SA1]|nr:rod-binding protein [Candidatus Manganitrophus morganii]
MEGRGLSGIGGTGANPLKAPEQATSNPEEIKKAAEAFESYFIFSLLKEMRKTVPGGGFLGSGPGKEIYESLLDETMATKIAQSEGIGLAKLLVKKLADQSSSFKGLDR